MKVIQTMALLGAPYLLMPATALVAGIAFALIEMVGLPSLLNDLVGAYLFVAVISAWACCYITTGIGLVWNKPMKPACATP